MATKIQKNNAAVGDWVEARGLPGQPSRGGEIIEVIGQGDHEHYRVRWDERHESILYPADAGVFRGAPAPSPPRPPPARRGPVAPSPRPRAPGPQVWARASPRR